jgi:hypothetical protein
MAKKETGNNPSSLASAVLRGAIKPTAAQTRTLAASVLSQDEHKGPRPVVSQKRPRRM